MFHRQNETPVNGTPMELADQPPSEDALTAYDEAHFRLYMALLNAEASNVPSEAICRAFLGIDAAAEPDRARTRLESHLRRARWFAAGEGFRHLLGRDVDLKAKQPPESRSQESKVR